MSEVETSVEEEIAQVDFRLPHVVILGAGASCAATPAGDRNGRVLPLMANLVEVVGLKPLLARLGVTYEGGDFEATFSELARDGDDEKMRLVEHALFEYFSQLAIPEEPNLYDHLVLALRRKDLIATFNWDPLLLQAYRRVGGSKAELPRLAFLHGNVGIGYCPEHRTSGLHDDNCSVCGAQRTPAPLLYPIADKDYSANEFIANEWRSLENGLRSAFMLSIFGYSAPKADALAIAIMKGAWGSAEARSLEEIEIISTQSPDDLRESWDEFIHTHHYQMHTDFYESWLGQHPRRTGEAYRNQFLDAKFIEPNPIPRTATWRELRDWYDVLSAPESRTRG